MAENADGLAGMVFYDFTKARLDARAELRAAFAIWRKAALDVVEPLGRVEVEPLANLLPVQARPVAEINFTESGQNRLRRRTIIQKRRDRLLHTLHRTGVNGVELFVMQEFCQDFRLFMSARRKVHVNLATEDFVIAFIHLGVANEQQAREF